MPGHSFEVGQFEEFPVKCENDVIKLLDHQLYCILNSGRPVSQIGFQLH